MSAFGLVLLYLACGIATFPLTILTLRGLVMVAAPARATPTFHRRMNEATSISVAGWILAALLFYAAMVIVEWQKPCDAQRTNQITPYCKAWFDAAPEAL